ncbi:MAG: AAA family ATPase [Clostridiales bacterium]
MKKRAVFVCNSCGATSIKWYGRCPSCGEWNTLVEEVLHEEKVGGNKVQHKAAKPYPLNKVEEISDFRYVLGSDELDGVLGGGLVPGSSVLLGGEPGIGKSTLLLQLACQMAQKHGSVLYISGEESAQQIQMRAKRLDAVSPNVYLLAENNLQSALEEAAKMDIKLLIVDSVQAVFLVDLDSAPGSVSQVRACSAACLEYARRFDVSVILVGHVTKEGTLAGPRVLEHMVDTVLYFEGERYTSFASC